MIFSSMGHCPYCGGIGRGHLCSEDEYGPEWKLHEGPCVACKGTGRIGAETKMTEEEMTKEIVKLRTAIHMASSCLDPPQGNRVDPSLAYKWLRTTYPEGHPNFVNVDDLEKW